MKIIHRTIQVRAPAALEFVDITESVQACVKSSGIRNGLIAITSQHTTAAIRVNENEKGFREDFKEFISKLLPAQNYYRHNDGSVRTENIDCDDDRCMRNGHSHVQHMLLGTSETLPIIQGQLKLGRWQRIFLIELCSPRKREVVLTVVGK